ncbi:MAG: hypothetical protein R3D66_05800 [Alphaproteobacteria bacterium]
MIAGAKVDASTMEEDIYQTIRDFLSRPVFEIERGILVARNDPELNRVIGVLGHDLDMAQTRNDQALRRAAKTYGAVLDNIREAPLGKRFDMERFIAPGRGEP